MGCAFEAGHAGSRRVRMTVALRCCSNSTALTKGAGTSLARRLKDFYLAGLWFDAVAEYAENGTR